MHVQVERTHDHHRSYTRSTYGCNNVNGARANKAISCIYGRLMRNRALAPSRRPGSAPAGARGGDGVLPARARGDSDSARDDMSVLDYEEVAGARHGTGYSIPSEVRRCGVDE